MQNRTDYISKNWDEIHICELEVFAHHGVFPEEHGNYFNVLGINDPLAAADAPAKSKQRRRMVFTRAPSEAARASPKQSRSICFAKIKAMMNAARISRAGKSRS